MSTWARVAEAIGTGLGRACVGAVVGAIGLSVVFHFYALATHPQWTRDGQYGMMFFFGTVPVGAIVGAIVGFVLGVAYGRRRTLG
jgi:hypothetical protein